MTNTAAAPPTPSTPSTPDTESTPSTESASIVDVESDPVPIVLILAATLRRAERDPRLAAQMAKTKGNVALRSTVDPQSATLRFAHGRVLIERGVAPDTDVTIAVDVNRMSDLDAPKPKISGALLHLRLALRAGKVLDPPAQRWQDEAKRFWEFAGTHPRVPKGVRIVCTDDDTEFLLGGAPVDYEIFGSAHQLTVLFTGGSVFGQDLLDGKLHAVGSLAHMAELTGRTLAFMMGT